MDKVEREICERFIANYVFYANIFPPNIRRNCNRLVRTYVHKFHFIIPPLAPRKASMFIYLSLWSIMNDSNEKLAELQYHSVVHKHKRFMCPL
jgi:hypothetical protein